MRETETTQPRAQRFAVPGLSEAIAARGVPLTVAVKANGFVFVSGLPPIDPATGAMVVDFHAEVTH